MISEIWLIILSGILLNEAVKLFLTYQKILQKLSKIPNNSQKSRFCFIVRPFWLIITDKLQVV